MVDFINKELLKSRAPAVFADEADSRVSNRYQFIPTTRILSILQDLGWKPWDAKQVKTRVANANTTKHIVRLRHQDLTLTPDTDSGTSMGGVKMHGDVFPEMLVINSHDGRQSYQLRAGIFRMICSNGMVVSEESFGELLTRHIGFKDEDVYNASRTFCSNVTNLNDTVEGWRSVSLNTDQRDSFFRDAAKLRFVDPNIDIIRGMRAARRAQDLAPDLWTQFNVAQENLIRGGFFNTESRRVAKPIKSIQKDLDLNTQLWDLGTKYYSMAVAS
jgi:hypothetical protein